MTVLLADTQKHCLCEAVRSGSAGARANATPLQPIQRLLQIGDQILRAFDADRQPNQPRGNARLLETNARTHTYPEPEFSQAAAERWGLLQARAIATGTLPSGLSALPARAFALAGALPTYWELARGFATAQSMRLR